MRIAILHSGDLKTVSLGGVDRYIKSLISFCDDGEITVFGTTVTGEHEIGREYECNYCGKKYYFVPIIDDHKYPLSIRYMLKELAWISKMGEFDCIYAQRTEYSIPFLFSKHKKKLFEMIHGSSKYSQVFWGKKKAKLHLFLERIAIGIAERTYIILNREEYGVPYYKKQYRSNANRIFYGKNPINIEHFYPKDKKAVRSKLNLEYDNIILYSGRIEDKPKRVLLFPLIMREILKHYPNSCFVVIGDGNDLEKLKSIVSGEALNNNFRFIGYVDDPLLIADYNCAADVTINISMFEGTCTSNLESIACGTPVVSTDVGDIKEVLDGTHNGIIIENNQNSIVENAATAIESLLRTPISMNDSYRAYSGEEVVRQLRNDIWNIKN